MIKALLKLLVILVIGILVYNYFLGTPQEKKGVEKIVKEFKDFGGSVADLLKSEKEKFEKGKYDDALDKIGNTLKDLKSSLEGKGDQYNDEINDLLKKKEQLSDELNKLEKNAEDNGIDTSKVKEQLKSLLEETQRLISEMESGQ
ncbi:MAG: hypothetical protein CMN32_02710 [Saprospirales bacterium]|nr:hypothetical protein [Saprospirales bacterium]